ncbi:hypothetical protein HDK64DRAFT_6084 [Phyllosticta capitalensis]
MAPNLSKDSIWRQMNYTPPRGPCNHKDSLLSPKCPCLRFMLHPLKISSSFTCDGCDHHASFHSMASPADDAVIARWETESQEQQQQQNSNANSRARKRQRLLPAAMAAIDLHTTRASSDNVNNNSRAIEWEVDDTNRRRARSASPVSDASDTGAGAADAIRMSSNSSKTWGERFTSWSFGNVEPEPEKTPPKKAVPATAAINTKGTKRIAVPKSQVSVKKVSRPKKASAAGPSGSGVVLGSSNSEPIPLFSDTEQPD